MITTIKDDKGYNQVYAPTLAMQTRTNRRADKIIEHLKPGSKVYEIGCGRGDLAYYISQNVDVNYLGADICAPFIDYATENHKLENLKFEVLDFMNPETIHNEQYDFVIGNGILHHFYYDLDTALKQIHYLLKPNGKLIFWEPNLYNPFCYLIFNTTTYFRNKARLEPTEKAFSKPFIDKKLTSIGFKPMVSYADFLLPNTPDNMINFAVKTGNAFEKMKLTAWLAQSLFIVAEK